MSRGRHRIEEKPVNRGLKKTYRYDILRGIDRRCNDGGGGGGVVVMVLVTREVSSAKQPNTRTERTLRRSFLFRFSFKVRSRKEQAGK